MLVLIEMFLEALFHRLPRPGSRIRAGECMLLCTTICVIITCMLVYAIVYCCIAMYLPGHIWAFSASLQIFSPSVGTPRLLFKKSSILESSSTVNRRRPPEIEVVGRGDGSGAVLRM